MEKCVPKINGGTQHFDVNKDKNEINIDTNINDNSHQNIECPICYDKLVFINSDGEINENTPIKLDCGHVFHHKCILATFKTNLVNNRKTRRCPYCREVTSHLPLQKYIFPLRNIHKEYELIKGFLHKGDFESIYNLSKKYKFINKHKCHAIVTTGNNKGTQCKKSKKDDYDFCFMHYKKFSKYST